MDGAAKGTQTPKRSRYRRFHGKADKSPTAQRSTMSREFLNIIIKNIVGFRETPIFVAPKLKSSRPKRLKQQEIALCMVVVVETPTR